MTAMLAAHALVAVYLGAQPLEESMSDDHIRARLEHLRGELRAERISYGELAELESLREYIDPHDVELLEAAGVSEDEYRATLRGLGHWTPTDAQSRSEN